MQKNLVSQIRNNESTKQQQTQKQKHICKTVLCVGAPKSQKSSKAMPSIVSSFVLLMLLSLTQAASPTSFAAVCFFHSRLSTLNWYSQGYRYKHYHRMSLFFLFFLFCLRCVVLACMRKQNKKHPKKSIPQKQNKHI